MRTLTLLTALLLLAFQAPIETLQETADQVPTQDQPGDEDEDVAISFTGEERFTRQLTGFHTLWKILKLIAKTVIKILARIKTTAMRKSCLCRPQNQCPQNKVNKVLARVSWVCRIFGRKYKLCCK